MDFFQISTREIERGPNKGQISVYPDFVVGRSTDLMVRGRAFYAIWDEDKGLWSKDEYDVQRLVDLALRTHSEKFDGPSHVEYMRSFKTNGWSQFRKFLSQISDNAHELDTGLTFSNTEVKKTDYVSRRLSYSLAPGDHSAWDELVDVLYAPEERAKIEWAIGSVIAGDSKKIQKFVVLYGSAGTGKSTIMNIVGKLFDGYTTTFEAKALGSNNGTFATEVFKANPLVAIQHDGDLSKIEDNTRLNSIISHEPMVINEKHKPTYTASVNAFLWMGTNQPVKISDAKSGIIRRLIDIQPTGVKLEPNHYHTLMARIEFELGAIAHHCLTVYRSMGKNYYNTYRPLEMMLQTDFFFNFVEAHYDVFKYQDGVSVAQAYALYKEFCADNEVKPYPRHKMRSELSNYFEEFHDRITIDGATVRSYFKGFTAQPFKTPVTKDAKTFSLVMDQTTSIFNLEMAEQPAQYAKANGTPSKYWDDSPRLIDGVLKEPKSHQVVDTLLQDIDPTKEHYVQPPEQHIVLDFDLTDEEGNKSLERNLEAASSFPPTYGELSKSGEGVHLHYNYDGDVSQLEREFLPGIEIKVFTGNSALRRRLSRCNNVPIATINSGLPLKEKKPVLQADQIKSEKGLRDLIERNLRKEIHPGTKPSIDFIHHILEEAYLSGLAYDVTDMRSRIIAFANNSTNQYMQCLKTAMKIRYKSDTPIEQVDPLKVAVGISQLEMHANKPERRVFYDVEVFPNLFIICWKYEDDPNVVRMINPTAQEVEQLFSLPLVGFNNRRYDNHILYAAYLGYNNEQLYKLSKKIIDGVKGVFFGEAFNISYSDIYDFSSIKKGLKKFQIELGLAHKEMDLDFDTPVDPKDWDRIVEYCVNDVNTTEAVFKSRYQDFVARQILAELSGLSVNDTTAKHTAAIIFGGSRNPQSQFVYTKLAEMFPGYKYEKGVSTYRDEVVGEGGYVYSEPGMYENVALLDVASMHPTSIIELNAFGDAFTPRFRELVDARLAIKAKDYDTAGSLMGGRLKPYLGDSDSGAQGLSDALKIVINIVYGLTSAKFDNAFRDIRNVDNIVAKRGALFMIDLKYYLQEQGVQVIHIKTDSVKIPNITDEIIEKVKNFGDKYGYKFEYNPTKDFYDKLCLVNDAVYIARQDQCISPIWTVVDESKDEAEVNNADEPVGSHKRKWTAVGAQFQHPYIFKTLFSGEQVTFEDLCETKQVSNSVMLLEQIEEPDSPDYRFIGKTGRFVPVREGLGGYDLVRVKDGKRYAVTGTKGYKWVEVDFAKMMLTNSEGVVDMSYFEKLAKEARATIEKFGDFEEFVR